MKQKLQSKPYYNDHHRSFEHYYDTYHTNKDKIDRIMIDSMQKGFSHDQVLNTLDQIWSDCGEREEHYQEAENDFFNDQSGYFELYLRNVIRKILVFDRFDQVFAAV